MGRVKDTFYTDEDRDEFDKIYVKHKITNARTNKIKRKNKLDYLRNSSNLINRVYIHNKNNYDEIYKHAENEVEDASSRRTEKYFSLIKEYRNLWYAKKLVRFPKSAITNLKKLKNKFPHADKVIDSLIAQIHLQQLSIKSYAKVPPILLVGEPGTGKSALAKHIVKCLAPRHYYLNLAVAPEAFFLSGLTLGYEGGTTGEICKILKSKFANNFVILEEIDKAIGIGKQSRTSPVVPLLELLESESATKFKDDALELEFDTSYLSYISTANKMDDIPSPILSRMLVFRLDQPTEEQIMTKICQSIWSDILKIQLWGHVFSPTLSLDIRERLSLISPRKIKSQLELAASFAAQRHKKKKSKIILNVEDLRLKKHNSVKKVSLGFIPYKGV